VTGRYDGHSSRALQSRPSGQDRKNFNGWYLMLKAWYPPFSLVIDHEFEDTVSVRGTECNRVCTRGPRHRWKRRANVGVKHGEFKL
jgi:hypothetical protein